MIKYSIRYFNNKEVRAVFDITQSKWWYSAVDVISIITNPNSPRRYWNNIKKRNQELSSFCGQLKLYSKDGKKYLSDVIDESGIKVLCTIVPTKYKNSIQDWLKGLLDPIDEQSKRKAYELYKTNLVENDEIGKTIALQKIHAFLFEGLYDFAGKIRNKTISNDGFTFANGEYLSETLHAIDKMPVNTFDQIVEKYVEMNIAHPFYEGNGRATRIWLDQILEKQLMVCVDWSKINKNDYLNAMRISSSNDKRIKELLSNSLTNDINNREIFMKGIDTSYYYEEE